MDLMLCFHSQLLAVHLERCCLGLRGPCAVHHCGKSPPLGVEGLGLVGPATLSSCPPQPVAAHTPPPRVTQGSSPQMALGEPQVHAACEGQSVLVGAFRPGSRSCPASSAAAGTVLHVWGVTSRVPRSRGTGNATGGAYELAGRPAGCSASTSAQARLPHGVGAPTSGQGAPSSGGGKGTSSGGQMGGAPFSEVRWRGGAVLRQSDGVGVGSVLRQVALTP